MEVTDHETPLAALHVTPIPGLILALTTELGQTLPQNFQQH